MLFNKKITVFALCFILLLPCIFACGKEEIKDENVYDLYFSLLDDGTYAVAGGEYDYFDLSDKEYRTKKSNSVNFEKIEIPSTYNGVTVTVVTSFRNCPKLKEITIPNGVKKIGDFGNCPSLTEIVIPNAVEVIGDYAFNGCISLKKVALPAMLKKVGNYAFNNCTSLKDVVIPDKVKKIGSYAFSGCVSLESLDIPNSVDGIGSGAFTGCTCEIVWGNLPEIKMIDGYVFSNYKGENLTIPTGVTEIGEYVFYSCVNLKSVSLPATLKNIAGYVFGGCSALEKIYYDGTKIQWEGLKKHESWQFNMPDSVEIEFA